MTAPNLILPYDDYLSEPRFVQRRSGLIVPREVQVTEYPTCIDFFSGCGGFSLGAMQAGFKIVAAIEYDETAMHTYMVNLCSYPCNMHFIEHADAERFEKYIRKSFEKKGLLITDDGITLKSKRSGIEKSWQHTKKSEMNEELSIVCDLPGSGWIAQYPDTPPCSDVWLGDVRKLKGSDILEAINMRKGEIDMVVGGPPCQGFSQMNTKRNAMDPRNSLVFEYARMILELEPKTFVMENVPAILEMYTPDGFPVVDEFCRIIADGGYGTMDGIKNMLLNTSGLGAALKSSHKKEFLSKKKRSSAKKNDRLSQK